MPIYDVRTTSYNKTKPTANNYEFCAEIEHCLLCQHFLETIVLQSQTDGFEFIEAGEVEGNKERDGGRQRERDGERWRELEG
jgi:hypothetical protein